MQPHGGTRKTPRCPSNEQQIDLGCRRGHFRSGFLEVDVDLAAHPESRGEVNPRLDREADARQQLAVVRGLKVVEVGPGAVQVPVDRVTGAVHEKLAISGLRYYAARRIVELGARHRDAP